MSESSQKEDIFTSRDARTWQDSQERYRTVTSAYTVQPDDDILICDTTSGTFTVTLPNAITKRKITLLRIGGSTQVTVVAPSSQTINGGTQYNIATLYVATIFKGMGDKYYTLSTLNTSSILQTNSATSALTLRQTGAGNVLTLQDENPDTTPTVVDSSGRFIQGHTAWESEWYASGHIANHWTAKIDVNAYGYGVVNYGGAAGLLLMRSNAASIGSRGIVSVDNRIGQISFAADDGVSAPYIISSAIYASIDGTPGTNDMPGRLMFLTTADGASSPTERMRIDKDGKVTVYGSLYVNSDKIEKSSVAKMYYFAGF